MLLCLPTVGSFCVILRGSYKNNQFKIGDLKMKPTNNYEALVLAIKLGLTAETDNQVSRIDEQLVHFASLSTQEDIELAKVQAIAELETSYGDTTNKGGSLKQAIKNSMILDLEWIKLLKQAGSKIIYRSN